MSLVIFDVCDTLFATNTTVGFLRHLGDRGDQALARRVRRWTNRTSPGFWIGALAHRLLGHDLARRRLLRGLRGYDRTTLIDEATTYVRDALPALANEPVMARLRDHHEKGDQILLLSNSIDVVVDAIGRQLDVKCHSSRLAYQADKCLGTLDHDLTGRKADIIRAGQAFTVYTDNRSDLALIEQSTKAIIILPRGAAKKHWAGDQHDYLPL